MPDLLLRGGDILSLDVPDAEAVLVRDGRIAAVGAETELLRMSPRAEGYDLDGACLAPGFLDAHSHITALASTMELTPLDGAADIDGIVRVMGQRLLENPPGPGEWLNGFGYDQNTLKEGRHPSRRDLDRISTQVPIVVTHASGHMGVFNTRALELLGITAQTPDPDGGRIGRQEDGSPDGYLEEAAFIRATRTIPEPSLEQKRAALDAAQRRYLSYGITTVQDGATRGPEWLLLRDFAEAGRLLVDVVAYADQKNSPEVLTENLPAGWGSYRNRLRLGGWKIFLDGSPQGRTAWMSEPYEGAQDGYRGYPAYPDAQVREFVREAMDQRVQLLAHCNGDAAAEQFLSAWEQEAGGDTGLRPVMIHAQTVRRDQLARMAALGMIASFFIAHVYQWGDVHRKNLGPRRAERISPAHSALDAGVCVTFHQDTPVLPPDMLHTVWCAVTRVSRNGVEMGREERISVRDALDCVTRAAAYQYFEEDRKGAIAPGMAADFAVLSENPLDMEPDRLGQVRVLETWKDGKSVWRRKGGASRMS